jgi:hypothetical protein
MSYSCWLVSDQSRDALLAQIPPEFPDVIAHHVTMKNPSKTAPPPADIRVLGQIIDPSGVQVLIVEVKIDGEIVGRGDGSLFHITWSIDRSRGKKPFSSVDTIARMFDTDFDPRAPQTVETAPMVI